MHRLSPFALFATLFLPCAALQAQDVDLAAAADTVFARWNSTHTPGCAVGVSREGKVLLTRGYGMADLETGTPITAATIFESGSVAKQFTATAILLLAQEGKLNLDDPARKYVPELPEYDQPITIRHLLTHTSGLREWSSLVAAAGWPRGSRAHTQAELLDMVFRQKALNYPVGEHYSYTNTGYALAMTIVERVSGKSFQAFTRERIFQPLGMTHTHWRDDFTRLVPGRAQAYSREDDGWHLNMPFENVVGPGGLLTTVGDWLTWNDALSTGKLGRALVDSLTRRMRLNNGREIQYARGLMVLNYRGLREISHSGSTAGYSPLRGEGSCWALIGEFESVADMLDLGKVMLMKHDGDHVEARLDIVEPSLREPDQRRLRDLALLEREHVLHRLFLRLGGDRLLVARKLHRQITGFGNLATMTSVDEGAGRIQVTEHCPPSLSKNLVYDPATNPRGARCTVYDHAVNVYGRDAATGFARRPLDNVGVQYGLAALNRGAITTAQFLDLNEKIGGYDNDGNRVPRRTVGDPAAIRAAFSSIST